MISQSLADRVIGLASSVGVERFFISPGSRSQSLVLAVEQLAQVELAESYVRVDERSMSFMALGNSVASDKPSALIVTSGTAVANLHPAMLEAHHAGIPLIAITADRPTRLRGKGSNQTTLQPGIFGELIEYVDVQSEQDLNVAREKLIAALNSSKPIQLNVCFDEPLSGQSEVTKFVEKIELSRPSKTVTEIDCSVRGVVIAGAGGDQAREFAESANWPLFAEPSSGARSGNNAILNYEALLKTALSEEIQSVVVFGKPTLTRVVNQLIGSQDQITVVSSDHGVFDIGDNAVSAESLKASNPISGWLEKWQSQVQNHEFGREQLIQKIYAATNVTDSIYLGASKMIRIANNVAPAKEVSVYSNRGLAGIDGSNSTAIGISLNTAGVTRAIIGDLTAIHDVGGLNLSSISQPNVQLWVVNDSGGKIFEQLEIRQQIDDEIYSKYFQTPQVFDLALIAKGFGWGYQLIENSHQLDAAIDAPGPVIFEIKL